MTFCFFSAQYVPTVGGVERYTFSLAKQLIKKGHNVIVVTSALKGLNNYETDENGIKIYRLPVFSFMNGRFPVIKACALTRKLKQMLKNEKIDFCVVQTRFYTNSLFGADFACKNSIPAIVIEHGTAHLLRGGITGFCGNIYEHWAIKYIYKRCKNFYGVSKACCSWLMHFGIKTDKVLYNAVDPVELNNIANECDKTFLEKHIKNSKTIAIAFLGRFIPEKGVLQLAAAFEKLKSEFDNIVLIMAGDGELLQNVSDLNVSGIVLTGKLPYNQSLALMQRANIFCLPTFSEGFATTVLEAAALKTTILTTPTGGSTELIYNKDSGLLFEGMDTETIYKALKFALQNPEWCAQAGKNANDRLLDNFTWDKVSQKLINIAEDKL